MDFGAALMMTFGQLNSLSSEEFVRIVGPAERKWSSVLGGLIP